MNAQHTRGTWEVDRGQQGKSHRVFANEFLIAQILPIDDPLEQLSNAYLIASAPELLEAAIAAVAALSQPATFPADIDAAKKWLSAAIAKARGQS